MAGIEDKNMYKTAFGSMGNSVITSLWDYIQQPENKARIVDVLDPLIQHIIKSIFPYVAFSAALFVLLLVIAILTLLVTLKASGYNPVPSISIPTDFLSSISFANPINAASIASTVAAAVETVEGCVTD
uniref:Uncharacterized protein n=1 Tax=viral metagenome TaxID=1070528 RepID=A0A6C0BIB2_9ZZZZ